jgi:hypothetical protein
MALSSISVVGNSLLLRRFTPGKKDYISAFAPAIMSIAFTLMFVQFARISSTMAKESNMGANLPAIVSMLVKDKTKIAYSDTEPKLFLETVTYDKNLPLMEGSFSLLPNEVVLGVKEAMMMREEKLFTKTGDEITNLFGASKVKISGILAETGTVLDYYHLVSPQTYKNIIGASKFFSNTLNPIYIGNTQYTPVLLGSKEAEKLSKDSVFKKTGDRIERFLGTPVIITDILPETGSALDYMYFSSSTN